MSAKIDFILADSADNSHEISILIWFLKVGMKF